VGKEIENKRIKKAEEGEGEHEDKERIIPILLALQSVVNFGPFYFCPHPTHCSPSSTLRLYS
jgi:hypothetical protein